MLTNELQHGTLLPPGVYAAGDDCPANRQCDICPLSGKCEKLRGLQTAEAQGNFLLPAMFHRGESRPGQGAQGDYEGEALLPPGVA